MEHETLKPGQTVTVTDYGVEKHAIVTRNNGTGVVFVQMRDTGRERWFHAQSLRVS